MPLSTPHRRLLESAVKQARRIATGGARKSLEALAVHEPDPYRHMDDSQRTLCRKLRAQAKQLGDGESLVRRGYYEIAHLVEKLAYDQWHRILFARYLLENDLLISPDHGVAVSLDDCEELASSLGLKDAWAVAARFAAVELPEIFRADDPAGAVELPVEDRKPLIDLVTGLPRDVFTATDSLGWCYQFWQADKKDEVNASGNKIGADELPSVTQLFTEDYMVDFLLDNTLGAWWGGKRMKDGGKRLKDEGKRMKAETEEEARAVVALPGCPWKYLRFVKVSPDGEAADSPSSPDSSFIPQPSSLQPVGQWLPAAGTFDGWPHSASSLRLLDPCMGSGHFIVAMFERLVALRMAEENLDEAEAVAAVIRDNLFGLEIDPRCTQIAAFNLALAAWRRVGHCKLPPMNLACSGLAPNAKREDWLALTASAPHLRFQMGALYDLFSKAPVLGSLINPRADKAVAYGNALHELQPLLEQALAQESKDDSAHEMAVAAQGIAKAAEILAGEFTLVATNVPYLGRNKQNDDLMNYCDRVHPKSKADLATSFIERCLSFCSHHSSTALVTPQNWLFLGTYRNLRQHLLKHAQWDFVTRLGPKGFQTPMWDFNIVLFCHTKAEASATQSLRGIDVSGLRSPEEKSAALQTKSVTSANQKKQLNNPDARVTLEQLAHGSLLQEYAIGLNGMHGGDSIRFRLVFWEQPKIDQQWRLFQGTTEKTLNHSGREHIFYWPEDGRIHKENPAAYIKGGAAWGKPGVVVSMMAKLPVTLYSGEFFDISCTPIIPYDQKLVPAIWCYCSSPNFSEEVRKIDQKLNVTNATLVKVPFDLAHWQKVAAEKYPNGLPKPHSDDPTQWLFHGHPNPEHPHAMLNRPKDASGHVILHNSSFTLQVAAARLLGYRWPRQTGSSFPDCPALEADGLEPFADEDGIVCLSATKGEKPAAERLRELLVAALGKPDLPALLASAGPKGSKSESLEDWLRDEFFEQHCALFHHRPFIWHIWDGQKNGFSALVNYHSLTHAALEKLTYAYLGDWIRRQDADVKAGESGSDARLQAAKTLQARLKLILEGEPPYDIFVRWKPLSQQAIGWHPDLNDGVRMNIRPFLAQDIPGGKKGAGILRAKPNIKWEKDRGKEPQRDKSEFPWFWKGTTFTGDRVNDVHLSREEKERARQ